MPTDWPDLPIRWTCVTLSSHSTLATKILDCGVHTLCVIKWRFMWVTLVYFSMLTQFLYNPHQKVNVLWFCLLSGVYLPFARRMDEVMCLCNWCWSRTGQECFENQYVVAVRYIDTSLWRHWPSNAMLQQTYPSSWVGSSYWCKYIINSILWVFTNYLIILFLGH